MTEPLPNILVEAVNKGSYELKLVHVPLQYIHVAFKDPAIFSLYVVCDDVLIPTFHAIIVSKKRINQLDIRTIDDKKRREISVFRSIHNEAK